MSSGEAKASLAGLLSVGAIEYVDAPPPSSLTSQISRFEVARLATRITSSDPYEILGIEVGASTDELRSAYLGLLKSCDPAATTDPELRPILKRMSDQLVTAYRDIERRRAAPPSASRRTNPPVAAPAPAPPVPSRRSKTGPVKVSATRTAPPKVSPPPPLPVPVAGGSPLPAVDPARALEMALQAFDAGKIHEALAILHDAIPRLEGRERRAARVRKARILLTIDNGARLAEEELRTALGEDPGNAEARVVLGGIYHERGSLALAMMEYRKALELQPRNVAAREAIQALSAAAPAPQEASVLKRIFGR